MDLQTTDGGLTIAQARERLLNCAAESHGGNSRARSAAPVLVGAALLGLAAAGAVRSSRGSVLGKVARLAVALRLARWAMPVAISLLKNSR